MWLVRRWWVQFIAGAVSFLAIFFGSAIVAICITDLSMDLPDRALRSFMASALLWCGALYLARAMTLSREALLTPLTPMTPRQYFMRNIYLQWPMHFLAVVVAPFMLAFWAEVTREGDGSPVIIDQPAAINALLFYYAILLGPLAEHFAGFKGGAAWVFIPRYLFRRYMKSAVVLVIAGAVINRMSGGAILDALRAGMVRLFDAGDIGLAFLAMLSPVSVIAVQHEVASDTFIRGLGVVLVVTIAIELVVIVRSVLAGPALLERMEFEAWIEHRAAYTEAVETAAGEEEEQLEQWAKHRPSYEGDVGIRAAGGMLPYIDSLAVEDQVWRHARHLAAVEEDAAPFLLQVIKRAPFMTFLVLLVFVWISLLAQTPRAIWIPTAALAMVFWRNLELADWWRDAVRISMGVPLRLSRLVRKAVAVDWRYDLAVDVFVVLFFSYSWGLSPVMALSLLATTQIVRVSGHFGKWLGVLGEAGSVWPARIWLALAYWPWFFAGLIVFQADIRDLHAVWEHEWLPAALPGVALFGLLFAMAMVSWLHRKTDYSIPIHRSSYDHKEDEVPV